MSKEKEVKRECNNCGNNLAWGWVKGTEENFRYPKTKEQWKESSLMISSNGYKFDELSNISPSELKEYRLCEECKKWLQIKNEEK